ncbi:MAG: hypothetical protein WCJ21_03235 [Planctomycetota bacterium]
MADSYTTTDLASLERSIASLSRRIDENAAAAKRRQWITGLVMGALLLGMAGYLNYLYRTIVDQFADPQTMVELAYQSVKPQIDQEVGKLGDNLKAQAPQLVAQAEQMVLDSPPQISREAQTYVASQLDTHLTDLEGKSYDLVSGMLKESVARAKAGGIDLNDDKQVDKLVGDAAPMMRDELRKVIRQLYTEYAEAATGIGAFVNKLTSGAQLSPLEERQREVLLTGLALIQKIEQDPNRAPLQNIIDGKVKLLGR